MKQATTPSLRCVSVYLVKLKQVQKVEGQDNGQHVKLRCLPRNTNRRAEDIATNGFKEVTEVPQAMDRTEVENRVW